MGERERERERERGSERGGGRGRRRGRREGSTLARSPNKTRITSPDLSRSLSTVAELLVIALSTES